MNLVKFYDIIDKELVDVIERNKDLTEIKKHKNVKNKKGYAALIWFLEFYGQKSLFKSYIVDGKGDNSCDIIFSNVNGQGEKFFYVIQSKWRNIDVSKKIKDFPEISKDDFGKAFTDFSAVLNGTMEKGQNADFNRKYEELKQHLEDNGKVKFIFFSPVAFNKELTASTESFNQTFQPNVTLEVIGLERLRTDYIELKYKEVSTNNPLEYTYEAEESTIEVEIERSSDNNRDIFEYQDRSKSYIFLLRPKTVFELFDKFKFSLFFKNIRNPLHESNYNEKIVETLNTAPSNFWYFNNGVTAITKVVPEIGVHTKKIKIEGLQVINGAQTFYSVYQAYLNASPTVRKIMDTDARVMLRLIRSSNDNLNTEITKFTNSQNPLHDRDFFANDEVQIRLQNESFETNFWYEKRRGEFRNVDKDLIIISNKKIAPLYVAFHQQKPFDAVYNQKYFFISRKENTKGLYESIFDKNTQYQDILASSIMIFALITAEENKLTDTSKDKFSFDDILFSYYLAFSKIVLNQYLMIKYKSTSKINLSAKIINLLKNNQTDFLKKIVIYSKEEMHKHFTKSTRKVIINRLTTNPAFYETIKLEFEESDFKIEDIDNIEIPKSKIK